MSHHSLGITIGQKLAEYKARRRHVSDIKEPMVRALWWKHWEWKNAEIAHECGSNPEFGALRESSEVEIEYARKQRRKILVHLWAMRVWAGDKSIVRHPITAPNEIKFQSEEIA